jgi:hypothetical protein
LSGDAVWNKSLLDGPIPAFTFLGLDEEGQPMFGAQLPAYNLNIAAQIYTSDLEPYRIEPALPKRVFAGAAQDTVFLTFADEAEAIAALGAYWTELQ